MDNTISNQEIDLNILTSNVSPIEKYIEDNIEKKINQLLLSLPDNKKIYDKKYIYNYTLYDIYKGVIQTIIDIIEDLTTLNADRNYISNQIFRERLFNIFLNNDRKIYIGIILIFLSFIMYFIDGASI